MSDSRLTDRAYAAIVGIIIDNNLQVGDRLPSENRLGEQFGMSRPIVREALVRLGSDGITLSRRGAGSYVKRRPSPRLGAHIPLAGLAATLGTYEVRLVLEAEAARLAAQRRSDESMVILEERLRALRAALLSDGPAHDEDWQLHRAIIEATGNTAFLSVFDHLYDDVSRILKAGVDISRTRPPRAIEAMMAEHEAIVEAIRAQDPDDAALAMRWHLSQGRKRLMP
ncbi:MULTISPECIES: FadR/GntR family transcriptional regulator [unclassified Sphingomonas]|uniref:FadR/GntR family transcriptional regulator n=1 Tax=unclassified Sphingomonas TaxID=196159 RepID=UPI0006FCAD02|nr:MULTISPECIES: FCD domain-containing protein [unclassified Sphingomonas]KQM96550.1 GntR family transcriptional regulator [Sphingomonas sp. Leaf25]KQN39292.1 GntR family transcriptional regulator [Sphingomonas sp. Leaf42]KQT28568.1 GntR family transcriptional regulator [Sphingomonas sp. Leaf407]